MADDRAVSTIVASLLERMDEVVEKALVAIWEAVPSYGRSGEPLRDEVRSSVRGNVETLGQVLAQGRDIRKEELEFIEGVGARRAEAAIPLDDVLQAYRTVSRVVWDFIADEVRGFEGGALEATISLAEAVLRYTDQISSTVAEAYSRAQRTIVAEHEGARREFLSDVLHGSEGSPEELLRSAHTFGYDLSLSYVALAGESPDGDQAHQEQAVASAARAVASHATAEPIVLQKAEQTLALLPMDPFSEDPLAPEKLVAELGGNWKFGMGGPALGLEGIRRAYLEAREALEIGRALELEGPVYRFDDLLLYHFLRMDRALVDRFVDQMLGPLLDYDERRKGELTKTLEAYFRADGSVKFAGKLLFAHPHTVSYRIKQIERLTGWSLRDPEDKLRLQLALRASRLANLR